MRRCLAAAAFVAVTIQFAYADVRVQMKASSDVVAIDAEITLQVDVTTSGGDKVERFSRPMVPGFELRKTDVSEVTTKTAQGTERIETRIYLLRAQQVGVFSIESPRVIAGGIEHKAKPVEVEVVSDRQGVRRTQSIGGVSVPGYFDPDVEAETLVMFFSKDEVLLNGPIVVSWVLYSPEPVVSVTFERKQLEDAKVIAPNGQPAFETIEIDGQAFHAAVVSQQVYYPQNVGYSTVRGGRARVQTTASGWRTVRAGARRLKVQSITGQTKKMPVGVVKVRVALDKDEVRVGDGLTVSLLVDGPGSVVRFEAPQVTVPEVRVEKPEKLHEEVTVVGQTTRGSVRFGYWVRPARVGTVTIPAIPVQYIDPIAKEVRTISTKRIVVRVLPGTAGAFQERELAPIVSSVATRAPERWLHSTWFILVAFALPVLCALAWVLFLALPTKDSTRVKDVKPSNSERRVGRKLRRHIRKCDASAWAETAQRELLFALYGEAAERAQKYSLPQLKSDLDVNYSPNEHLSSIHEQFARFDVLRYTSRKMSQAELEQVHAQFMRAFRAAKEMSA